MVFNGFQWFFNFLILVCVYYSYILASNNNISIYSVGNKFELNFDVS